MNKITITINTENAAFQGCPEIEISRILKELSENVRECKLRDINGNTVGKVEFE